MHDAGTVLQRQSGYPRRRLHHAGSADAEQQVALAGRGESLAQRRLGSASPNQTTPGRTCPPQAGQRGGSIRRPSSGSTESGKASR